MRFSLSPSEASALRRQRLERAGWRCENPLCRRPAPLECDHVVPRSQEGPDTFENLAALCVRCHADKGSGLLLVIPNGDGTHRFRDLRKVVTCESCHRAILSGELAVVPTPNGGVRTTPVVRGVEWPGSPVGAVEGYKAMVADLEARLDAAREWLRGALGGR